MFDSRAQFHAIQDDIQVAAQAAGVPAIWFDDVWAGR